VGGVAGGVRSPSARRAACFGVALGLAALGAGLPGCGHGPHEGPGSWYVVRPGDTLWSLALGHGSSVAAIERANGGIDARALRIGQRLWIPRDGGAGGNSAEEGATNREAGIPSHDLDRREAAACGDLARSERLDFEWPVLGHLTSAFGAARAGHHGHDGIDLVAPAGTPIHAAEAGRVIYAGEDLGDYGKVIVIKHLGRWATVYAHNRRNLVREGDFVEKGDVIAEVGDTGNATTAHLHFEVRRSNEPRDPQDCLP
jgi:murein DD-endopeptidase MepM/ murein hydrolase activator NlpD